MSEEFKYYNDYIRIAKHYLRNLNKFKVALKNLDSEAKMLWNMLEDYGAVAAPVASYGGAMHGVYQELNSIEAVTEKRLDTEKKREIYEKWCRVNNDVKPLELIIQKVETAIEALPEEDRGILKDYVVEGKDVVAVAEKYHYSDKTIRTRANKSTLDIAIMLFGIKVQPMGVSFVFAD